MILVVAVLAAFALLTSRARSSFAGWLSAKDTDELYATLHEALWLVIVGVIIEEWKLLKQLSRFVRFSLTGRFREALSKAWKHRGDIVEGAGFFILVIGLAAELAIAPLIETSQKKELQAANERAGKAEKAVADARIQIAGLGLQEKAQEAVAQGFREKADKLELEIARIKAPRTLSNAQVARIVRRLKPSRPQQFRVLTYPQDRECVGLAHQLILALQQSGWTLVPYERFVALVGLQTGVSVRTYQGADKPTVDAAAALVAEINRAGIFAELDSDDPVNPRDSVPIHITIGAKPPSLK